MRSTFLTIYIKLIFTAYLTCTNAQFIQEVILINKEVTSTNNFVVPDLCGATTCGQNAKCRTTGNIVACTCPDGFKGNPFVSCTIKNPCEPNPCGIGAECHARLKNPMCTYPNEYEVSAVINSNLGDPCGHNPCGINADCLVHGKVPVCTCPNGYEGDPHFNCTTGVSGQTPCLPNPCGINADCHVRGTVPVCTCPCGYQGDPHFICTTDKCTDGQPWKQDCNICICVAEQKTCTNRACKVDITGLIATTSQPTYSGMDLWKATSDITVNQINNELDLWNSARDGNFASVKTALGKGINPNWKNQNQNGRTSLHIAALNNHPWIMTVLLDAGADNDMRDNYGFTPIFAASDRGSKDAVLTLIENGADVDITTNSGYTPLMQATGKGYTAIVEALIGANANIHMTDNRGEIALFVAASYNRPNIAILLLLKGADPRKTDNDGRTAADHARYRGYCDLANNIDGFIGWLDK